MWIWPPQGWVVGFSMLYCNVCEGSLKPCGFLMRASGAGKCYPWGESKCWHLLNILAASLFCWGLYKKLLMLKYHGKMILVVVFPNIFHPFLLMSCHSLLTFHMIAFPNQNYYKNCVLSIMRANEVLTIILDKMSHAKIACPCYAHKIKATNGLLKLPITVIHS